MSIGILLAGGLGTRLYPLTQITSKQLLPLYNKPMIYYSLSILMLAGIRDIVLISSPTHLNLYKKLLKNGNHLGVKISYVKQNKPRGLADAFIVAKKYIENKKCMMVLGDNFFHGSDLEKKLIELSQNPNDGAAIFSYKVNNPQDYGVVIMNKKNIAIDIIEKPKKKISNLAIPGIYFYDKNVYKYARTIKPSKRGELEITSLNKIYLKKKKLSVINLGRGTAWLDTGSPKNFLEASNFIENLENRQGLPICCPEEIAFKKKWISKKQFQKIISKIPKNSDYRKLLESIS